MKQIVAILVLIQLFMNGNTQENYFSPGNSFPNYVLRPVINAPDPQVDIHNIRDRFIIINFWGTWCAPCIPEMDTLAKLQKQFNSRLRVIAVSNEESARLAAYLKKRPTDVWLASDTTGFLYSQTGFDYVGQSIVLDPKKKIVALVRTDSINTSFIEKLINGKKIRSSAEISKKTNLEKDHFGIDSTSQYNVSLRSPIPGLGAMSTTYFNTVFQGRRRSYFNVCPTVLFKEAYSINSENQIQYEGGVKIDCDHANRNNLVCFDLLVKESQKDSFKLVMQKVLNQLLPYKARVEHKLIPVLLLKRKDTGTLQIQPAAAADSSFMFSGRGFTGKSVHLGTFANYLTNELRLPVIDETGLAGTYDIKTENVARTRDDIIAAVEKIGFVIEKGERRLPVLVISHHLP